MLGNLIMHMPEPDYNARKIDHTGTLIITLGKLIMIHECRRFRDATKNRENAMVANMANEQIYNIVSLFICVMSPFRFRWPAHAETFLKNARHIPNPNAMCDTISSELDLQTSRRG